MLKFGSLDQSTQFLDQQKERTGPVTIINTFVAPEGKEDEVLAAWTDDAAFMKAAGGLLSAQLYRGIGGSRLFTNVAVWQSTEHLRAAFGTPEFAMHLEHYPVGTVAYPHLYQKFAVEGVCEGEE
ncbi:antibiotic biosynthesis monooxygenase family protein [Streptomyces sp. NPDC091215]|uniref:antibiotic biosynthesis monooxygenase family protein n=1 Tax=Streptomyces sp. NPDC091215 TaxID=3155192 RepID=UPI003446FE65